MENVYVYLEQSNKSISIHILLEKVNSKWTGKIKLKNRRKNIYYLDKNRREKSDMK